MFRKIVFIGLLFSSFVLADEKDRHVPTLEDLFKIKTIGSCVISPDAKWAAYTVSQVDFETNSYITQIWLANVSSGENFQLTRGKKSSSNMSWSPDGNKIAFSATINPDYVNSYTSGVYVLNLTDSTYKKIVSEQGPDRIAGWSPDGDKLLISTYGGKEKYYALNSNLVVVPSSGGKFEMLTEEFDENPGFIKWNQNGVYFGGSQKTASHLFHLNPKNKKFTQITKPDNVISGLFSFSEDGRTMACYLESASSMREIYISKVDDFKPKKLTNMTDQTKNLIIGKREVISWKSKDGTMIEGVLVKPENFSPSKKHPLLCIIHGGPTGIDRPILLSRALRYYPVDI